MGRHTDNGIIGHESFHTFKQSCRFYDGAKTTEAQGLLPGSAGELQVEGTSFAAIRDNRAYGLAITVAEGVLVVALERDGRKCGPRSARVEEVEKNSGRHAANHRTHVHYAAWPASPANGCIDLNLSQLLVYV